MSDPANLTERRVDELADAIRTANAANHRHTVFALLSALAAVDPARAGRVADDVRVWASAMPADDAERWMPADDQVIATYPPTMGVYVGPNLMSIPTTVTGSTVEVVRAPSGSTWLRVLRTGDSIAYAVELPDDHRVLARIPVRPHQDAIHPGDIILVGAGAAVPGDPALSLRVRTYHSTHIISTRIEPGGAVDLCTACGTPERECYAEPCRGDGDTYARELANLMTHAGPLTMNVSCTRCGAGSPGADGVYARPCVIGPADDEAAAAFLTAFPPMDDLEMFAVRSGFEARAAGGRDQMRLPTDTPDDTAASLTRRGLVTEADPGDVTDPRPRDTWHVLTYHGRQLRDVIRAIPADDVVDAEILDEDAADAISIFDTPDGVAADEGR